MILLSTERYEVKYSFNCKYFITEKIYNMLIADAGCLDEKANVTPEEKTKRFQSLSEVR